MLHSGSPPQEAQAAQKAAASLGAGEVERLFRDHNDALLRFIAAKLGSVQEAKDVAQEAYVRLLRLEHGEAVSYLRAFLFKTASNLALDRLRQRARRRFVVSPRDTDIPVFELSPDRQFEGEQAGDAFRADWPIEVPVLLVNGELDWSTPIENARHARRHLKQGHLIEIEGGVHCDESVTMPQELPVESELMYSFIDADFQQTTPEKLFATLPASVAYRPLNFAPPVGPSLYEQWQVRSQSGGAAR